MNQLKPYLLTLLIHPQAEAEEKHEIEKVIKDWLSENGGEIKDIKTEDKRRISYTIGHTQQVALTNILFEFPGTKLNDLTAKLRRQKKILRFRVYQHAFRAEGKTIKDIPTRSMLQQATKEAAAQSTLPPVEKAPLAKLDEKIEEILEEKVL